MRKLLLGAYFLIAPLILTACDQTGGTQDSPATAEYVLDAEGRIYSTENPGVVVFESVEEATQAGVEINHDATQEQILAERYGLDGPAPTANENQNSAADKAFANLTGRNADSSIGSSEEGFEVVSRNEYTGVSITTSYTPLPLSSDLDRRMSSLRGFHGKYQAVDRTLGKTNQTYLFDNLCPEREEVFLFPGRNQFGIGKGNANVPDDDLFRDAQEMVNCATGLRPVRAR